MAIGTEGGYVRPCRCAAIGIGRKTLVHGVHVIRQVDGRIATVAVVTGEADRGVDVGPVVLHDFATFVIEKIGVTVAGGARAVFQSGPLSRQGNRRQQQ
jgi:hypothetical protein